MEKNNYGNPGCEKRGAAEEDLKDKVLEMSLKHKIGHTVVNTKAVEKLAEQK